jgi:shikimate kinase
MIIVLNGPIGIGKSTLAQALTESIEYCVMLDGDELLAANPPPANELAHLHSIVALLVTHYRGFGYRHFVMSHLWRSSAELADLRRRVTAVEADADVRCFLLTLPADENLRRIERRQRARAIDEREFELRALADEREALSEALDLGERFDVSARPPELVALLLDRLGFERPAPNVRGT